MADSRVIPFEKGGRRVSMDEVELVAALRRGDAKAYAVAWLDLGPMVRRLVGRFFGPGAEISDLAQEVFLRFFRRIGELRSPDGLRGFLAGICLGVARNELRRVRVRRWVGLTSTGNVPDPAGDAPDIEAREALRRLYRLLDRVSAEDRSLFVARFLEKMEMVEVAEVHGLSYGTAKRRVSRAVGRIHKQIVRDPALGGYLDSVEERDA